MRAPSIDRTDLMQVGGTVHNEVDALYEDNGIEVDDSSSMTLSAEESSDTGGDDTHNNDENVSYGNASRGKVVHRKTHRSKAYRGGFSCSNCSRGDFPLAEAEAVRYDAAEIALKQGRDGQNNVRRREGHVERALQTVCDANKQAKESTAEERTKPIENNTDLAAADAPPTILAAAEDAHRIAKAAAGDAHKTAYVAAEDANQTAIARLESALKDSEADRHQALKKAADANAELQAMQADLLTADAWLNTYVSRLSEVADENKLLVDTLSAILSRL